MATADELIQQVLEETGSPAEPTGPGAELAAEGRAEHEELIDRPGQAFVSGAVSGFTGLPVEGLQAAGENEDVRNLIGARKEENALAGSLGQVLGFGAGALTGTGGAGLLVKGSLAAGKTLGKVAGKGALSKGVTLSTAGAIEGAGIALSDASGRAMIDNQYGPGAAAAIAESVAEGAMWGAGGAAAAMGLGSAANFVFRKSFKHQVTRYKDLMKERKGLHQERVLLEKEVAKRRGQLDSNPLSETYGPSAAGARYAELTGDRAVSQTVSKLPNGTDRKAYYKVFNELEDTLATIEKKKADATVSMAYGSKLKRSHKGIDELLEPLQSKRDQLTAQLKELEPEVPVPLTSREAYITRETLDPKGGELGRVRRKLNKVDKKIERLLTGAIDKNIIQSKTGISEALTVGAATAVGGVKGFMLGRFLSPFIESFRGGVLSAASKRPLTRAVASSSIRSGKLSYAKHAWDTSAGDFVRVPYKYDKYFQGTEKLLKAFKVPPIQMMTQADFEEVADEIRNVDLGEIEHILRTGYAARGAMQESVNPQVDAFRRQVEYLRKTMPVTHSNNWIASTSTPKVPESQRLSYSRRVRATVSPVSVPTDFLQWKLTPEAAHAWWATNPEVATEFASQITDSVQLAVLNGRKFTPKEQYQIGLMTDPMHEKVGRLKSVNMVQSLQKYYVQEDEQTQPPQVGGPPKSGGVPDSGYESLQNVTQQLETRASKRA